MAIDQARLLTMKAAWALDTKGTFGALTDISAIKVVAPNVLQFVTDAAMQIHGGEGMSDPELTWLFGMGRALRLADPRAQEMDCSRDTEDASFCGRPPLASPCSEREKVGFTGTPENSTWRVRLCRTASKN